MIFNNIYASLSLPNLVPSIHPSAASAIGRSKNSDDDASSVAKDKTASSSTSTSSTSTSNRHIYEYEDILKKKNNINYSISDILARESDVIVSNKITSKTEYNGFAIHLLSICSIVVWLTWSMVPRAWFESVGIYYYPDRWWQLAISSYVLMAMIYIYVGLALYNIEVKAVELDDIRNIVDEHAVVSTSFSYDEKQRLLKGAGDDLVDLDDDKYLWRPTSGVWDLPITTVSKVLYSDYGCDGAGPAES